LAKLVGRHCSDASAVAIQASYHYSGLW
jgi:hypothetical protein